MYDFCFVVFSYNQEKYIVENLESIRHIILKFGNTKKIQIVYSDDASKDNTVYYAKRWLSENAELFSKIDIINHESNVGTIRNLIDACKLIDAYAYKAIAGDDLFFPNDVFSIHKKGDMVISLPVSFNDAGDFSLDVTEDFISFLHYRNENKIREGISKMYDYSQCIPSPGVFISIDMWRTSGVIDFISPYKFIEDIPEWYFFLKKYKSPFEIYVEEKPYILYRKNVGVTKKIKSPNNPVNDDFIAISKSINFHKNRLKKFVNPFVYLHFLKSKLLIPIWMNEVSTSSQINNWKQEAKFAKEYINLIKEQADKYLKSI